MDLENTENWALEEAELRPPVQGRRAVVSVSMPSDDFALVARSARQAGMKTSEFIRVAAIEKARHVPVQAELRLSGTGASGEATFLFEGMVLSTRGNGRELAPA